MLGINGIFEGDRLGILHVDGLSLIEPLIVFIVNLPGTFLGTQPTGNALVEINIPGQLDKGNLEVPLLSLDALHLREGEQLNIDVPADLDQLGRDNSHGTVIGGKGLIQL